MVRTILLLGHKRVAPADLGNPCLFAGFSPGGFSVHFAARGLLPRCIGHRLWTINLGVVTDQSDQTTTVRYAAIGDSFTEGVGDDLPDGSVRGWADLVAEQMARRDRVEYVNLAIRGRLLAPVAGEQLDAALALRPTVLTFNGGGNDVMRPHVDLEQLRDLTERVIARCQDHGVRPVLLSGANPSRHLPLGSRIDQRGRALTELVGELAASYRVPFVDNFSDTELSRAGYWSPDRLHLGPAGHRRVAARVLTTLGYDVPAGWMEPLAEPDRAPSLAQNAAFYRRYVGPWVMRRLRRRSSGDGRAPKFADWHPITADSRHSSELIAGPLDCAAETG